MSRMSVFGIVCGATGSLLIVGEFWISYFRFCRFNTLLPLNDFVHLYTFAGDGLIVS
jgi:hypothetical protein